MASEKTLKANKKNAQLSTGPTTVEGKAVVRYNAVKHGLRAEHLLLPDEDKDELAALREGLYTDLEPCGVLQCTLFDLILAKLWRLQRVSRIETAQLRFHWDNGFLREGVGYAMECALNTSKLSEYERSLENAMYKAIAQYQMLKFSDAANKNGFVRE